MMEIVSVMGSWLVTVVFYRCASQVIFAPPPAEASEIVHQDALAYSEFSQGVG